MSDSNKTNQSRPEKKNDRGKTPIKVIRRGAIAASIWKRQTSTGFEYLDYSLSRSWRLKSGEREGYSQNFFADNADALMEVITLASEFVRSLQDDYPEAPSHTNIVVGEPLAEAA